jgi:hypothetical protein
VESLSKAGHTAGDPAFDAIVDKTTGRRGKPGSAFTFASADHFTDKLAAEDAGMSDVARLELNGNRGSGVVMSLLKRKEVYKLPPGARSAEFLVGLDPDEVQAAFVQGHRSHQAADRETRVAQLGRAALSSPHGLPSSAVGISDEEFDHDGAVLGDQLRFGRSFHRMSAHSSLRSIASAAAMLRAGQLVPGEGGLGGGGGGGGGDTALAHHGSQYSLAEPATPSGGGLLLAGGHEAPSANPEGFGPRGSIRSLAALEPLPEVPEVDKARGIGHSDVAF